MRSHRSDRKDLQTHSSSPAVELLFEELPARHPQEIYDMIHTIKRKVRAMIRQVVAETVEDPADVDPGAPGLLNVLQRD